MNFSELIQTHFVFLNYVGPVPPACGRQGERTLQFM
jgi:hypothetical protein